MIKKGNDCDDKSNNNRKADYSGPCNKTCVENAGLFCSKP